MNPIQPYAPRGQVVTEKDLNEILHNRNKDDETTVRASKRRNSVDAVKAIVKESAIPCLSFRYVLVHGTELNDEGSTDDLSLWIYGRGTSGDIQPINSVGRGITTDEVRGYFCCLFRYGP